jgi:DNA-binding transcriptional MerR regulator
MSMVIQVENEELDEEWVCLILAAREMGITVDEIRKFLKKSSSPVHQ